MPGVWECRACVSSSLCHVFFFFWDPISLWTLWNYFFKKQILLLVQVSFKDGHKQLCLENCPQELWHLIPEALGGSTVPSHPSNTKEDISAGDFVVFDLVLFFPRASEVLPHSLMCSGKARACLYCVGVD